MVVCQQSLGCPLVEGLFLREPDSMQELLCTPSLHRTDILKWICVSICPSLKKRFSSLQCRSAQTDDVTQEMVHLGHELMLCKPDDLELIKGLASPLQQLLFLEQLLTLVSLDSSPYGGHRSARDVLVKNEELLGELMSPDHLADLNQLLTPTCNPWSAVLREHLRRAASAQPKTAAGRSAQHGHQRGSRRQDSTNGAQQHSALSKVPGEDLAEATALLQSTQNALEELHKECEFLRSDAPCPSAALSPCALRVAISDLSQLMSTFSHVYNTDFKGYCQRALPALSPSTRVFQSVHQLLHTCNTELQALQQLSDASSSLTETVRRMQTERRYWANGEKRTLSTHLEELMNKYTAFLSLQS